MLSKSNNGWKIALIYLAKKLDMEGFKFIDCQMYTKHLESMGGELISWKEFKEPLDEGISQML